MRCFLNCCYACVDRVSLSVSFADSVLLAWVLTNALLAAAITTTNSKASDGGANKAVNGYMAFLLASVAGLARAFLSLILIVIFADLIPIYSHSLCRIDDVYGHSTLRWRVNEKWTSIELYTPEPGLLYRPLGGRTSFQETKFCTNDDLMMCIYFEMRAVDVMGSGLWTASV